MFFYAFGNLHVVNSWGTRETKQETKKEDSKHKPEKEETGVFFFFSRQTLIIWRCFVFFNF
jgi:hypothetical protein